MAGAFDLESLSPATRAAIDAADGLDGALLDGVIEIGRVAAPTFQEKVRATLVGQLLSHAGLDDVQSDEIGDVWGTLRGADPSRALLVEAHMDTVFGLDVDVTPRLEEGRLYGPGIRDNSVAVAAVIRCAQLLVEAGYQPPCDVIFAGSVGEEGLGDLRGMRALIERHRSVVRQVLVVDGYLGDLVYQGVGSVRYKATFTTQGGHSWGRFGAPSAVHVMGSAIHDIASIELPPSPRSSFNVGKARGGTGVNVIAERAEVEIDVRSVSQAALDELAGRIEDILRRRATEKGAQLELKVVGRRPAGEIDPSANLLRSAIETLDYLGIPRRESAASTNANIPLSLGIPAVSIGAAAGDGVHTMNEFLEVASIPLGIKLVLIMIDRAASDVASDVALDVDVVR